MARSWSSPEGTSSDWSGSFSDCEDSSSSSNIACRPMDGGYLECYSVDSLSAGRGPQGQQQLPMPVDVLPSSYAPAYPSTGYDGGSSTPVRPDGGLKPPRGPTENPRRKRYATEDDWRNHKDRISSLYRDNTLKHVIVKMETKYKFHATERMYKARFKEWGVEKNVTAAQVHRVLQKVDEVRRKRRSPSAPGARAAKNERVVLELGEDTDFKRVQKYVKRNPTGLARLAPASRRSLEAIRHFSVPSGKGGAGLQAGQVSIPATKLDQRSQEATPEPSDRVLHSSPDPYLPHALVALLDDFVDSHFDCPPAYASLSSTPFSPGTPPTWDPQSQNQSSDMDALTQSLGQVSQHDQMMLDFVLNFRIAHTLLEDGLTNEGMRVIDDCIKSLTFCLKHAQDTNPVDTTPATRVVLWALSVASEMINDFKDTETTVSQRLLLRIAELCIEYQPTMAELAERMLLLEAPKLAAMLKAARHSISQALPPTGDNQPAFETYLKTLEVADRPLSPRQKALAIQGLAIDPVVQVSPVLKAWMEMRVALAVSETSKPFIGALGLPATNMPPSWCGQRHNKVDCFFGQIRNKIEWYSNARNWPLAQILGSRCTSVSEVICGRINEAATDPRRALDGWITPDQMVMNPSLFYVDPTRAELHMDLGMPGLQDCFGVQLQDQQLQPLQQLQQPLQLRLWPRPHPKQEQGGRPLMRYGCDTTDSSQRQGNIKREGEW